MSEGGWVSSKTEETPILVSEGTGEKGALQLLADQYGKRLRRILHRNALKNTQVRLEDILYYNKAEAAVRALYADAT